MKLITLKFVFRKKKIMFFSVLLGSCLITILVIYMRNAHMKPFGDGKKDYFYVDPQTYANYQTWTLVFMWMFIYNVTYLITLSLQGGTLGNVPPEFYISTGGSFMQIFLGTIHILGNVFNQLIPIGFISPEYVSASAWSTGPLSMYYHAFWVIVSFIMMVGFYELHKDAKNHMFN